MSKHNASDRSSAETLLAAKRFTRRAVLKAGAAAGAPAVHAAQWRQRHRRVDQEMPQLRADLSGPDAAALMNLALFDFDGTLAPIVDDPSKVQRYKNILNPSEDKPFQERLFKWENAFAESLNHLIKNQKRQAHGYATWAGFKGQILWCFGEVVDPETGEILTLRSIPRGAGARYHQPQFA